MMRKPYSRGLVPLLLLCLFTPGETLGQGDLEREFFSGVEAMEKEYRDFEEDAFEAFRREVQAMWQDFVVSTKKVWFESCSLETDSSYSKT